MSFLNGSTVQSALAFLGGCFLAALFFILIDELTRKTKRRPW